MKVFITGTDTDIGKTLIASWLCLHTKSDYWKPIQAGSLDKTDAEVVFKSTGVKIHPGSYVFENALSPHAAAHLENTVIEPHRICLPDSDKLVVEGAGGVLVPIAPNYFIIDLILKLHLPVIVVSRSTLGTINHTCLTLEALRSRKIPIMGVIMNGPLNPKNKEAIEVYGQTQVLTEFPPLGEVTKAALQEIALPQVLKEFFRL